MSTWLRCKITTIHQVKMSAPVCHHDSDYIFRWLRAHKKPQDVAARTPSDKQNVRQEETKTKTISP